MSEVMILVAPDGSEMLFPLLAPDGGEVRALLGIDTAKVYATAKLREQELTLAGLSMRVLAMSKWKQIACWFALDHKQAISLTEEAVNWMLGMAQLLKANGFVAESEVSVADMNDSLPGDDDE